MHSPVSIREALPDDWPAIVNNNVALARETEGKVLRAEVIESGVRAALADPAKGRYFLARIDGTIAGQTMVTVEWSDWRHGWFWWLQSVYVVPAHRRHGVFRALYGHIRARAQEAKNVRGLRLYVERRNQPALDAYEALGMTDSGYTMLEEEWSVGDEAC